MFSSFNFEDPPNIDEQRKVGRKDRSVRYLRSLSAQPNERTPHHPTDKIAQSTAANNNPQTIETTFSTNSLHPPSKHAVPRRSVDLKKDSKWLTLREKGPQLILNERTRQLDLNKGIVVPPPETEQKNEENKKKSFGEIVKSAMKLRMWLTAMEQDERESEPDRPTITNAVEITTLDDEAAILDSVQAPRPTGVAIMKAFFIDSFQRLIYFHINQNSTLFYYWTCIIALGCLYNMFAMVIFIFDDVREGYFSLWVSCNLFFDFCYLVDVFVGSRITFVSEGNEVKQTTRMRKNYQLSQRFTFDMLSLLPLDLILFIYTHVSLLRAIRLFKAYRLYEFVVLTQRRTDFPHFMKILFLTTSCAVLFHWNACVYFLFSLFEGLSEDDTNAFGFSYYKVFDPRFPICEAYFDENCWFPENENVLDLKDERPKYMQQMYRFWENKHTLLSMGNFSREYSMTVYWSSLTITKCGQQPWPSTSPQNALEIFDTLIGVLVFATIIGSVGNVVTQMSQNVNDFREMMDGIKFYMKYRGVKSAIQERVLNCFMYLNSHNQLYDEKEILAVLPPRFQAIIASNLHSDTLSKVTLFYKCDPRLIGEAVMLVKQQVYSPNDYLCRKGEKAKEMFIVRKGLLGVIDDDTGVELDQLSEGSTFGELSIIHVKGNLLGDKRSVSLRSVGYSDVYILHQDDVAQLLQEYPEERLRLLANARHMLHSKGLLETTELGEMCENDTLEDEGNMELLSLEEKMNRMEKIMAQLESDLGDMITSFAHTSVFFKQRITALENIYNSNKKRIRADVHRGVLKTDYDFRKVQM